MSAIALFRFLNTPGELWTRAVGLLLGVKVVVLGQTHTEDHAGFRVALSPDNKRMRISLNEAAFVLSKEQAADLVESLSRAVGEMEPAG